MFSLSPSEGKQRALTRNQPLQNLNLELSSPQNCGKINFCWPNPPVVMAPWVAWYTHLFSFIHVSSSISPFCFSPLRNMSIHVKYLSSVNSMLAIIIIEYQELWRLSSDGFAYWNKIQTCYTVSNFWALNCVLYYKIYCNSL